MYGEPKQKLNNADKQRIKARFSTKMEEFKNKTADELKTLMDVKMSSTDKYALEVVIDGKIKANLAKEMEENKQITEENGNANIAEEQSIDIAECDQSTELHSGETSI